MNEFVEQNEYKLFDEKMILLRNESNEKSERDDAEVLWNDRRESEIDERILFSKVKRIS
jgi:hypothetical protein